MKRLVVIKRYINRRLQGGRFTNLFKMIKRIKKKSGDKSRESEYIQIGIQQH
jgi:ribosomal protein S2